MKIKEKRVSLNLTQDDIARELNVSRTTVTMWENGQSMPTSDKLPKLAQIFDCSIDELFQSD